MCPYSMDPVPKSGSHIIPPANRETHACFFLRLDLERETCLSVRVYLLSSDPWSTRRICAGPTTFSDQNSVFLRAFRPPCGLVGRV